MLIFTESDIEDALQETTLKAWLQINKLKKDEYFKTWLIRILINECYYILRKRRKVISLEEIKFIEGNEFNSNEKIDLWNALNALSDDFRAVIVLFYYEDLFNGVEITIDSIVSDSLGITLGYSLKTDMEMKDASLNITKVLVNGKEVSVENRSSYYKELKSREYIGYQLLKIKDLPEKFKIEVVVSDIGDIKGQCIFNG